MASWCSVEQEYHNLFNGHYGCLEFLLLSLKGLSIILFIFLLDSRIIKRQRHRIQIQKSNVTFMTNLSGFWTTWLKCESQVSLLVRSLPPPSECNLNPKTAGYPKGQRSPYHQELVRAQLHAASPIKERGRKGPNRKCLAVCPKHTNKKGLSTPGLRQVRRWAKRTRTLV